MDFATTCYRPKFITSFNLPIIYGSLSIRKA